MNLYNKTKAAVKSKFPGFFAKLKAVKKPFLPLIPWLRFGPVGYETIPAAVGYAKRRMFPNLPSKYSRVKTLKDIHKGQKMFIAATGPSLTVSDLDMLKGHLCMSVNSIVMSYDKTDWRPDYYVAIDEAVVPNVKLNMGEDYDLWHSIDPSRIILSQYFDNTSDLPEEVILIPCMRSRLRKDGTGEIKFFGDCFQRVCESYTVTYTAIQLAVYMGCSEIYLLGADCNYTGKNDHAFGFENNDETRKQAVNQGTSVFIEAYKAAKKYADAHGIKIFNATRGGKLEVFPRISLEDALTKSGQQTGRSPANK